VTPARGEAQLLNWTLRPTFASLVAAEEELGPLFALVERAAAGELKLSEMVALFWHCLDNRDGILRTDVGDAVTNVGLAKVTPTLKILLGQILQGR
jgi:Phage tail tube protein, GTA-gp10